MIEWWWIPIALVVAGGGVWLYVMSEIARGWRW
jgi:hypothetical protein